MIRLLREGVQTPAVTQKWVKLPSLAGHPIQVGRAMHGRSERLDVAIPQVVTENDDEVGLDGDFLGGQVSRKGPQGKHQVPDRSIASHLLVVSVESRIGPQRSPPWHFHYDSGWPIVTPS